MKLIESKAEYIPQATVSSASAEEILDGIYKMIELAGRTAYHSQDKITPTSAKDFVDRMIKSHHGAALEHGTVYLKVTLPENDTTPGESLYHYRHNPYSVYKIIDRIAYVTSNLRVLQENNWLGDLQYLCSPTEFHEKRYTMRFTCDRGVSHQTVRERLMSFLQESQRYCCYLKEKFGASVTFIQPDWIKSSDQKEFEEDLKVAEQLYFKWLNKGYKAEEARYFLINGTKTEIVVTGFASDWRHMLDLRYFEKTGKVSPDMKDLMQKAQKVMQVAGIWNDIMSKPSKFE